MSFRFSKMHGAGNDFIMISCRGKERLENPAAISALCSRTRGVGADGVIFISRRPDCGGFAMKYYNSDGSAAGMCGNGLRCAALYASRHLDAGKKIRFFTDAGTLETTVTGPASARIQIPVRRKFEKARILGKTVYHGSTGVPHAVIVVPDVGKVDVAGLGRRMRFHRFFGREGSNVNFVSLPDKGSDLNRIRTYERGVEAETSACGTGISAAAICLARFFDAPSPVKFLTAGDDVLKVEIPQGKDIFDKVSLEGPAVEVFTGEFSAVEQGR